MSNVLAKWCFVSVVAGANIELREAQHGEQYILQCGSNTEVFIQWFYQREEADPPVNVADLDDTNYVLSPPNRIISEVRERHEGLYSCDQVSTVFRLVVLGKCKKRMCSASSVHKHILQTDVRCYYACLTGHRSK